jgi:hypothetical protein
MAVTQYKGARYVPKFADPVEWSSGRSYESLTVVTYRGDSYTSKQAVPAGISIDNGDYWVITGNYNGQIEQYRTEVKDAVRNTWRNVVLVIGDACIGTSYNGSWSLSKRTVGSTTVYPPGMYFGAIAAGLDAFGGSNSDIFLSGWVGAGFYSKSLSTNKTFADYLADSYTYINNYTSNGITYSSDMVGDIIFVTSGPDATYLSENSLTSAALYSKIAETLNGARDYFPNAKTTLIQLNDGPRANLYTYSNYTGLFDCYGTKYIEERGYMRARKFAEDSTYLVRWANTNDLVTKVSGSFTTTMLIPNVVKQIMYGGGWQYNITPFLNATGSAMQTSLFMLVDHTGKAIINGRIDLSGTATPGSTIAKMSQYYNYIFDSTDSSRVYMGNFVSSTGQFGNYIMKPDGTISIYAIAGSTSSSMVVSGSLYLSTITAETN